VNRVTVQRGARIIGMAAPLAVGAFILYFVRYFPPRSRPPTVVLGTAYIVIAAVVLLAPRESAGRAAVATAVVTVLLGFVSAGNNAVDGLIVLTAGLFEGAAGWTLLKRPEPDRPSPTKDR
jgi:hypothetical protein